MKRHGHGEIPSPGASDLPQGQGIEVLFEDQDILAINKPEGLSTVPEGNPKVTRPCLRSILECERDEKLYVVHRLDKEVSGVILFARNPIAHRMLNEQFCGRAVQKVYLALVLGELADVHRTIRAPLREYGSGRMGIDMRCGKESRTEIRLIERLPGHSLVEVQPLTGRRHQIRVHLWGIGHPVAGDRRYGNRSVQTRYERLMLHALAITLKTPRHNRLTIRAPAPATFMSILNRLRAE